MHNIKLDAPLSGNGSLYTSQESTGMGKQITLGDIEHRTIVGVIALEEGRRIIMSYSLASGVKLEVSNGGLPITTSSPAEAVRLYNQPSGDTGRLEVGDRVFARIDGWTTISATVMSILPTNEIGVEVAAIKGDVTTASGVTPWEEKIVNSNFPMCTFAQGIAVAYQKIHADPPMLSE